MSEISEKNVKISVINIIKSLMEKVDIIQDHMGNFSREIKYIREKKIKMLEASKLNNSKKDKECLQHTYAQYSQFNMLHMIKKEKRKNQ